MCELECAVSVVHDVRLFVCVCERVSVLWAVWGGERRDILVPKLGMGAALTGRTVRSKASVRLVELTIMI